MTLQEMKALIEKHDTIQAAVDDGTVSAFRDIHAPDFAAMVRQLLPIALAAQALNNSSLRRKLTIEGDFEWHECVFCGCRLDHRHKNECPIPSLAEALKAVQE